MCQKKKKVKTLFCYELILFPFKIAQENIFIKRGNTYFFKLSEMTPWLSRVHVELNVFVFWISSYKEKYYKYKYLEMI